MNSINEVTLEHINLLSATELTELLKLLLYAESEAKSLNSVVIVPLNINTADGGEDGRIEWNGSPDETVRFKKPMTLFQNKATNLTKQGCYKEILNSQKTGQPKTLKSQIEDVVKNDGKYILFTNSSYSPAQIKERIEGFRNAIKDAGHKNYNTFNIEIYDANRIVDWTNEYPAAVTLVQGYRGINRLSDFRTWKDWEIDMPGSSEPYKTNQTIIDNMNFVREQVVKEKVVRVIGHSGLGKTRLVLEAFRGDDSKIKQLQSQLVYYDIGTGGIEKISSYILACKNKHYGIMVIDNCNEENHNALSTLIKSSGHLKLITIDFSSSTYEKSYLKIIRDNQKEIVEQIIEEKFKNILSKSDIDFITNRSEGYPAMAILFSDAIISEGFESFHSELRDDFIKKLVFGRNEHSEYEFQIVKACSVLSSFGFVDGDLTSILTEGEIEALTNQTDYVRETICGTFQGNIISSTEFYKVCKKYKKSQIIEQRGTSIMVKPTPLAINLAAMWWEDTPPQEIKDILTELSGNQLGQRLVERLAELDQLDKAKETVNQLWGAESPFGTAEVLNTELGSLLFRYVVEVNPEAMTKTLVSVYGDYTKENLENIKEGRRNLVWALEKLCFHKSTFLEAAKIMYAFAVAENEEIGNNATSQFLQFFQLFLSGTEATLDERLKLIDWGLSKNDDNYTKLAILALGKGLVNERFVRMGGAEHQGSGPPLVDYRPSWDEIFKYWEHNIKTLTDIACSDSQHWELAKQQIASSLRTLIRDRQWEKVKSSILDITKAKGNLWMEARNNLKKTVNFVDRLTEDEKKEINSLIEKLTPNDVRSQLIINVITPEWDNYEKDENGDYIDNVKLKAEAYAEVVVKEKIDLSDYLQDLLSQEQRQGFNFGQAIGAVSEDVKPLLEKAVEVLKALKSNEQNPEFIAGILKGKGDQNLSRYIIDKFINNEFINIHSFYLTRVLTPTFEDIEKLFELIENKNLSIQLFHNFKYGRVLDNIPIEKVISICLRIATYGFEGKWVALSVMFMYCHKNEDHWTLSKDSFKQIIESGNMIINYENRNQLDGYDWTEVVNKILSTEDANDFAIQITNQIIEFCQTHSYSYSMEGKIKPVIHVLFEKYFEICWDAFGQGLTNDYITYMHLENIIGAGNGNMRDNEGLLFKKPEHYSIILKWCKANPDIAPKRIAHMMPLGIIEDGKNKWHPFSYELIEEFGNDKEFLSSLSSNMGTFGTVGSSVPHYEKQKDLLLQLQSINHEELNKWVANMLDYTVKLIKREKLEDEERY
ncbi:MAG: hypothetical protein COA31_005475 [Flavobacteriales bacterium]|nr:hypothetical protein [Flavobacteriales bacterium]